MSGPYENAREIRLIRRVRPTGGESRASCGLAAGSASRWHPEPMKITRTEPRTGLRVVALAFGAFTLIATGVATVRRLPYQFGGTGSPDNVVHPFRGPPDGSRPAGGDAGHPQHQRAAASAGCPWAPLSADSRDVPIRPAAVRPLPAPPPENHKDHRFCDFRGQRHDDDAETEPSGARPVPGPQRSCRSAGAAMTPEERRLRGRMAAAILHSRYDSRALTHRARLAFLRRFIEQVDPQRRLSEGERLRRAEQARRAHFLRLALASSAARRKRRREREGSGR